MYGVSLLRWEKGSETPSCDGENGLRLPRSIGRSMRNEGVSDPFPIARGKHDLRINAKHVKCYCFLRRTIISLSECLLCDAGIEVFL